MPKSEHVPKLSEHRASGRAFVRLTRDAAPIYLGRYGTPEARAAYDRVLCEWLAGGRVQPSTVIGRTLSEVLAAYSDFADGYYLGTDGKHSAEWWHMRRIMGYLRTLYGSTPAASFSPLALKAVRAKLVRDKYPRKSVNMDVQRIRRLLKWAASEELIDVSVYQALTTVDGLRAGKTDAPERDPVRPIDDASVDAIRPYVSNPVWALIELQRLTGARAGELLQMARHDLDASDAAVWAYRPRQHKSAHRGRDRVIHLGPKAIAVVRPFLTGKPADAPLFSPQDSEADRLAERHEKRKTRESCGNVPGSNRVRRPRRKPGDRYTTASYRRAIARAIDAYNAEAKKHKRPVIEHWHPHRLRHSVGTNIRKRYGVEVARVVLGHSDIPTALIYAEADEQVARQVAAEVG